MVEVHGPAKATPYSSDYSFKKNLFGLHFKIKKCGNRERCFGKHFEREEARLQFLSYDYNHPCILNIGVYVHAS
jgi:hypothetical protein